MTLPYDPLWGLYTETDTETKTTDTMTDDTTPDETTARFENPYHAAQTVTDPVEQLAALSQFSTEETESCFMAAEAADRDGDWAYQKGRLDAMRTMQGLLIAAHTHARATADADTEDADGE